MMSALVVEPGPERLLSVLTEYVSPIIARSVIRLALRRCSIPESDTDFALTAPLLRSVQTGLALYVPEETRRTDCSNKLQGLLNRGEIEPQRVVLRGEGNVVEARSAAKRMATEVGFAKTDQVKIATAVSELARNAVCYAGGGELELSPVREPRA